MPKKSDVWQHFTRVKDGHGKVINKAKCNYCTVKKEFETKDGTSNLWKHLKKFHPQEAAAAEGAATLAQQPQPPSLPSALSGSTDHEPMLIEDESLPTPLPPLPCAVSQEPSLQEQAHHELDVEEKEAIKDLARMIGLHGYDPLIVEDDHFRSFVHRLNPGFKLPSCSKIEEMCAGIFQDHMKHSLFSLRYAPDQGKPSFAVGKAKFLEAAEEVLYLTGHFIDDQWNLHRVVVNAFKILPPGGHYNHVPLRGIPMISLDDSNSAVSTIAEEVIDIDYTYPFMIAGEMTADFDLITKLKDHFLKFKGEIICATYMDRVLHYIARFLLPDSKFTTEALSYLDEWSKKEFQEDLSPLGLCYPWGYEERWYSYYCHLEIQFQRFGEESDFETLLRNMFGVIYRAISKLLASTTPTSNLCLEELFKLRHLLQSQLSDARAADLGMYWRSSKKNVADVLREALSTVDSSILDSYMAWSIPLVLDPRYKLRHLKNNFETVFGSESKTANECTSEVVRKIKELFNSYIEDSYDIIEEMANDNCNPTEQTQDGESELDCYLQDSPARPTEDFDTLKWWKVYGSVQYPTVALMARDALAMPTCSKFTPDQTAHVRSIIRGYYYG